ncbi:MAG: heavy-metal-associated domain-containing protein [Anaerolineaceae bacterium]
MQTITYSISNISCGHCVMHIKQALNELEGIQSVEGDVQGKEVTVEFTDPATDKLIRETLVSINYPAQD